MQNYLFPIIAIITGFVKSIRSYQTLLIKAVACGIMVCLLTFYFIESNKVTELNDSIYINNFKNHNRDEGLIIEVFATPLNLYQEDDVTGYCFDSSYDEKNRQPRMLNSEKSFTIIDSLSLNANKDDLNTDSLFSLFHIKFEKELFARALFNFVRDSHKKDTVYSDYCGVKWINLESVGRMECMENGKTKFMGDVLLGTRLHKYDDGSFWGSYSSKVVHSCYESSWFSKMFCLFDISQCYYNLNIDGGVGNIKKLKLKYDYSTEYLNLTPQPDEIDKDYFIYSDYNKILKIELSGLHTYCIFNKSVGLQNIKVFMLTLFITLFFTIFLQQIWRMMGLALRKYKNKRKTQQMPNDGQHIDKPRTTD